MAGLGSSSTLDYQRTTNKHTSRWKNTTNEHTEVWAPDSGQNDAEKYCRLQICWEEWLGKGTWEESAMERTCGLKGQWRLGCCFDVRLLTADTSPLLLGNTCKHCRTFNPTCRHHFWQSHENTLLCKTLRILPLR